MRTIEITINVDTSEVTIVERTDRMTVESHYSLEAFERLFLERRSLVKAAEEVLAVSYET